MRRAIGVAIKNVANGGGPFGAIVVKDNQIVGTGANRVTASNDPTAHAEVMAIRDAAQKLGTYNLSGCTIYTSCEPCPMCLGAIYWARISGVYFGATKHDAEEAGFSDAFIYQEIGKPIELRKLKTYPLLREEAVEGFRRWKEFEGRVEY